MLYKTLNENLSVSVALLHDGREYSVSDHKIAPSLLSPTNLVFLRNTSV